MVTILRQGVLRMRSIIQGRTEWSLPRTALAVLLSGSLLAACSNAPEIAPSEQPLSKEAQMLLGRKGMDTNTPIFIRIFKEESELEVWKARADGRFYHYKTYPICNWSGDLGPKIQQGDKQAPEGFYTVSTEQLKPDSLYHLAFNLGYPNAYDRSLGRTGQYVMIHGKCKSAGCYAMTDALVEEIYALGRDALRGGQTSIAVHAFPFRMTNEKLARYRTHKWFAFWSTMKQGYDYFEVNHVPPTIAVCERRYVVDVMIPASRRISPEQRCPAFQHQQLEPFAPRPEEQQLASERIVVHGPKVRDVASITAPDDGSPQTASIFAAGSRPAGASALGFNQ